MKQLEQTLTSLEVAEMVGKDHKELLRDIRRYSSQLAESKIALGDFFSESTYADANNQQRPCFNVTKKGCEFIAHKMTGTKGAEFTAKYINRFHEMEDRIKKPLSALEQLKLQSEALLEVNGKVENVKEELEQFKQDLPLLGCDMDRITTSVKKLGVKLLGGKESNAYSDKSLRQKVYSDIYDQLKRQFGVSTYKSIKRSQCDMAVRIIEQYQLPIVLKDEIKDTNEQETFVA